MALSPVPALNNYFTIRLATVRLKGDESTIASKRSRMNLKIQFGTVSWEVIHFNATYKCKVKYYSFQTDFNVPRCRRWKLDDGFAYFRVVLIYNWALITPPEAHITIVSIHHHGCLQGSYHNLCVNSQPNITGKLTRIWDEFLYISIQKS